MTRLALDDLRLQPLRIPPGWEVTHNRFWEIDPDPELRLDGLPGGDPLELFTQDLLQLSNRRLDLLLDLGWAPEADPEGRFHLQLIRAEQWDAPLLELEIGDRLEVVARLEEALRQPEQ